MLSHVRAVLFDAVGTVLYPNPAAAAAYYEAGRKFGSRLTAEEVTPRYHAAFRRQETLDQGRDDGRTDEAREEQRWRRIVTAVFDDVPDLEGLFRHLWAHFASPANWSVFPDVAAAWLALERRGLTLGLASNFDARLTAVCQAFQPLARCENVFVSSHLGIRKPHAGFFAAIERELGLAADEILLVGDSLENDYQAALAAGWQALLICRDGPQPQGVVSLGDLTRLEALVSP